jgi:hypothetical protein
MTSSIDAVQSISVRDVAMVKVFRPPFFGAIGGGTGGAIAIYTRRGGDVNQNSASSQGMLNTIITGYAKFKEFYNPQYDNPNELADTDIRTTLYWTFFNLIRYKYYYQGESFSGLVRPFVSRFRLCAYHKQLSRFSCE